MVALGAMAQKSFSEMGGVYYAYPVTENVEPITVPDGYQPFYISHYGRHGSRWLPADSRYEWVLRQFDDDSNLTAAGKRLKKQLGKVWKNARGNGGQLTPLGHQQHRDIAKRMVESLPGCSVRGRGSTPGRAWSTDAVRACWHSPDNSNGCALLFPYMPSPTRPTCAG